MTKAEARELFKLQKQEIKLLKKALKNAQKLTYLQAMYRSNN